MDNKNKLNNNYTSHYNGTGIDNMKFENDVLGAITGVLNNEFGDAYYKNGYVSLDDVFSAMVDKRRGFVSTKNSFVNAFEIALNEAFKYFVYYYHRCGNIAVSVPKVNFESDEISFLLSYSDREKNGYVTEEIKFTKKNGKVAILGSPSVLIKDTFTHIEPVLSRYFDDFQKFKLWRESYDYNVETSIPNFFVKFQNYDIRLYYHTSFPKGFSSPFFRLSGHCHKKELRCKSSSEKISDVVSANSTLLFSKVFVKISDCPVWSQEELMKINAKKVEEANARDKKATWSWPFKKR